MKKALCLILFLLLAIGVVRLCCFTVSEGECVVITQWGRSLETIQESGLYRKMPYHKVNRFDKRINLFESQEIQLMLGDQNPLIVSSYVAWRISNPVLFFESVNNMDNAKLKLSDMVNSRFGIVFADYKIANIINVKDEEVKITQIQKQVMKDANQDTLQKYGIEIVQVGLKKIVYPTVVSNAVYQRMRAERNKVATKYTAEGEREATKIRALADRDAKEILAKAYKEAEEIKGNGDKEAIKIYSEAYGQDPEFFEFLKSLDIYQEVMRNNTTLIISTDSELFKYFNPDGKIFKDE